MPIVFLDNQNQEELQKAIEALPNFEPALDGVSPVVAVTETETGHMVSITDVNGKKSFEVKNGINGKDGTKGDKGDTGANGKSAYEYAQDGGYIGTESRFTTDISLVSEAVETSHQLSTEIAVERARIDQFVALEDGATTGDAELIDARIGADAVTYESAGDAVRSQITDVKNSLFTLVDCVKPTLPTITLDDLLANPGTLLHASGEEFYTEPKASISNPFYCHAGDNIKATLSNFQGNFAVFVTYDKNDNIYTFIGSGSEDGQGFGKLITIDHTFTPEEYYFKIGGVSSYTDNYSLTYTSAVNNRWQNHDTSFVEQSEKIDNVERQVFSLYGADYELGYLGTTGNFKALASYRTTKPIFVKAGTIVKYKLKHGSSAPIIALYADSAATKLAVATDKETEEEKPCAVIGSKEVAEGEYKVPKDGYIRFVNILSYTDGYVILTDSIPDNVKQYVDDSVKNIVNENESSEGSDNTELYVDGKIERLGFSLYGADYEQGYITKTGVFKENSIYRFTKPIFVEAGTTIKYSLQHGTALPIIAFYEDSSTSKDSYNAEKSVIGIAGVKEGIYTAPSDGYVRFVELVSHTDGYVWFEDAIFDYVDNGIRQCVDSNALKMNILCLGDSILGNDGQIVEYLSEFTGANVINGAFGGTSVSPRLSTSDKYYPLDGENLITALTTNDFALQNEVKSSHTETVQKRIKMLDDLDMSTIDLIILGWGTNDYTQGKTIDDISQSIGRCIDMLQTTYPTIRILGLTNTWRFWSVDDESGSKVYKDSDSMIYNVSTGKEIAEGIEEAYKNKRVSVLNSYQNMSVSLANAPTYFDSIATVTGDEDSQSGVEVPIGSGKYYSGVHFNKAGNEMYAHIIAGKIRSMY